MTRVWSARGDTARGGHAVQALAVLSGQEQVPKCSWAGALARHPHNGKASEHSIR